MSQEKVDRYKKAKQNREKSLKKEKFMRRLEYTATALVLAVLVGWFGYSIYAKQAKTAAQDTAVVELDNSAIDSYILGLDREGEAE